MLMGRIGRPGLLGTMARTAVITGTASATANALRRRQLRRDEAAAYEDGAVAAPPPAAEPEDQLGDQLARIASLHAEGALSDEEFAAAKQQLLR